MGDDMVKRMAAAMDRAGLAWLSQRTGPSDIGWADVPGEVFAEAALEEMKEPTEEMIDAGRYNARRDVNVLPIYRAMIEEALALK